MILTPQNLFDVLSDETRLRCLLLLLQNKELCVCDMCEVIGSVQPKISRHLATMRNCGLILDERKGQWVYYSLNPKLPAWTQNLLANILQELKSVDPHKKDLKNLHKSSKKNLC